MFDQFNKVLPHARRVMEKREIEVINNMYKEFKDAGGGKVPDAAEYKIVLVDWDASFQELVWEGSD